MIFKKAIPRRTFLRRCRGSDFSTAFGRNGSGAGRSTGHRGQKAASRRLHLRSHGVMRDQWLPATAGANFEMTPVLQQLAPFRDQLLVLSKSRRRTR